jgi:photosystem II stability/assembly factor-like uncharacterized protein
MNTILRRAMVLLFSFVAIFSSAASCNFFGDVGISNSNLRYGILKSDPGVYQGGYAFTNNVKNFKDYTDPKGLNAQSGIKLIQFNKDKLYYIAQNKGLFKTTNSGKDWNRIYVYPIKGDNKKTWDQEIADNDLLKITDVSFINESFFYVAGTKNEVSFVYKTTDAGLTFSEVYNTQGSGKNVAIEQVLADPRNDQTNSVFITTTGGGVFRSVDAGASWRVVTIENSTGDQPVQMGNLTQYGNKFFIVFKNSGLYLSDNGDTFTKKQLNFATDTTDDGYFFSGGSGTFKIDKLVQSPNTQEIVLIASKNLLLGSNLDQPFKQFKIPVQPDKINITDVAIDPREGANRMLMSVDSSLYETKDRGISWSVDNKIKQDGVAYGNVGQIIIDPEDTRITYLMLVDPSYKRGGSAGNGFGLGFGL